jgi:hypothetical protein
MFLSCGFDFYRSIQVPKNQARLFKKRKNAPLGRILNAKLIEGAHIIDTVMPCPIETTPRRVIEGEPSLSSADGSYKECLANPASLWFEYLLQECLGKIPTGNAGSNANDYETVIAILLSRIFNADLRNLKVQEEINEGRRRIDFVMTNASKDGFFWHLSERHNLKCPYILFECKNYKEDLKNNEFAQLADRLQNKIGQVGIIVCRSVQDETQVQKAQQDRYPDKLILVLDDEDISHLINLYFDADGDGLLNYLDDKAKAVIFSK